MSALDLVAVVTTIQPPTRAVGALSACLLPLGGSVLIVGDQKGPTSYGQAGCELLTLDAQRALDLRLPSLLPTGHYSRKNVGYLVAIWRGANTIYETDDDNAPLDSFRQRSLAVQARRPTLSRWNNVYRYFTDRPVWPRGLPLQHIRGGAVLSEENPLQSFEAPIQQGLANGSPDVDAIWRFVIGDELEFRVEPSICLSPGTWCPFNSQSTWWWSVAFPLLYLPSHCSFRMTDIWRSFVAQRCIWELGYGIAFHSAEVHQERNAHVLLRDFEDEIPGYLGNDRLTSVLEGLSLASGVGSIGANLLRCYGALVEHGFVDARELPLVEAWLDDVARATSRSRNTPRI